MIIPFPQNIIYIHYIILYYSTLIYDHHFRITNTYISKRPHVHANIKTNTMHQSHKLRDHKRKFLNETNNYNNLSYYIIIGNLLFNLYWSSIFDSFFLIYRDWSTISFDEQHQHQQQCQHQYHVNNKHIVLLESIDIAIIK